MASAFLLSLFFPFILIVDTITNVLVSPLCPPPPSLCSPFPLAIATLLSVSMCMHLCSLANPFPFFHPAPSPAPPLNSVSLSHVSMPLFLFCSQVYFVHQIPHISEIIWYLSSLAGLFHFTRTETHIHYLFKFVKALCDIKSYEEVQAGTVNTLLLV